MRVEEAIRRIVPAIGLLLPCAAGAYGVQTHERLSTEAVAKSRLGGPEPFAEWGMKGTASEHRFPAVVSGVPTRIVELIGNGSKDEDGPLRPPNHFFDPLATGDGALSCSVVPGPFTSSPKWAIEGQGQSEGDHYSYARARKAFEAAFKESTKADRDRNFGVMFESIGHVITMSKTWLSPSMSGTTST